MSWEIVFVLLVVVAGIVGFVTERHSSDLIAITIFMAILIGGLLPFFPSLPNPSEMLAVFANPAPITIAAMFIVSAALEKCGAIEIMSRLLGRLAGLGYRGFLVTMILGVALISAFTNNTPVVVVFLPVIFSLSRGLGIPASKLLIPLSYASIFGGTCTLVGTSTNILASGVLEAAQMEPIAMFELAWIGLPMLLVGSIYLVILGPHLLPHRESLTSILSEEERKEYLTEAFVQKGSPAAGKTLADTPILKTRSIRLIEVIRGSVVLSEDPRSITLREGDRLVLSCRPSGFAHARSVEGIDLGSEIGLGLETIAAHEGSIVEGIIGPKSRIIGQKLRDINFRQRYRMIVLALHRRGINLRDKLSELNLAFGDTLLMMGTDSAVEELRKSDDLLLLDRPATPAKSMRRKMPIVLTILAGIIVLVTLSAVPIAAAALIATGLLFLTGCLKPKEGYLAIDWSILFLIYGMLGLGLAMQKTGGVDLLAQGLISASEASFPPHLKGIVLLAAVYLCTAVLTELLSNNATIVLMAPIALGLASSLGLDPRPFVVAAAIASSASFSTPIGYQTNTYVYGAGGYRFRDFLKVGLPLNILYFCGSILLIPRIWSLH